MTNPRINSVAITTRRMRFGAVFVALTAVMGFGADVGAHDEIASSTPENQSQFDDPITEVTIDFGEPVESVELALVSPDDLDLPGTVTVVSDTVAVLNFAPLEQEGQYLVRYLAEEDGHLVAGAIAFTFGSAGGSGAGTLTWLIFGVVAAAILGIGAFFSLRRSQQPEPDEVATG
jgi:methionine-rich copper-binding protein CopC